MTSANTSPTADEFADLCDKSGVCLARTHLDRCVSQMTFEQMRDLESVSSS